MGTLPSFCCFFLVLSIVRFLITLFLDCCNHKPVLDAQRLGIEYGFMSTTTDRAVAVHYGQDWDAKRDLSYAMEFVLDSLNRGAMIQWLSQYPGEAEVHTISRL